MKQLQKPKLLPWLAHKAGISDDRADMLWNKAVALAASEKKWVAEGQCMAEAMQRMFELLAQEKAAQCQSRPLKTAGNRAATTFAVLFGTGVKRQPCIAR